LEWRGDVLLLMLVYFACKITIVKKLNYTPDISNRYRGGPDIPLRKNTDSLRCPSNYYFLSKNSSAPRVQNNKT